MRKAVPTYPVKIVQRIFYIRMQKVMFDFDLAEMYGVETRVLKQAVRRNINSFPKDFMFTLTKKEFHEVITNCDNLKVRGIISLPFVESRSLLVWKPDSVNTVILRRHF